MPSKQQFITTAYYKGTLVAVKKLNKKSVELNKNILMELKQVSVLYLLLNLLVLDFEAVGGKSVTQGSMDRGAAGTFLRV